MKVAIVSVFPPFRGGIALFNTHLVKALRAHGHAVHCINFSRQYPSLLFPGKTQYSADPVEEHVPALLDSINPLTWRATAKYINDLQVDRVLVPYWTGYLAPALTGVTKRLKNTRVTGILHNAIPHDAGAFQHRLGRSFFDACNDLVTLSQAVSDDLQQLHFHRRNHKREINVQTLFHPVYPHAQAAMPVAQAREALRLPAEAKVLLYFGLIRKYKGIDTLLAAFSQLPNDYYLVVAGEPYVELDQLRSNLAPAVAERVLWHTRFIEDRELPLFFGAADAVVLPYHTATQSGVTAVAMHFERPVIASNVGGLAEYIAHEKTGMLFPAGDAQALAHAIAQWFLVFRLTPGWEQAIARRVEALSWSRFAAELMDV